ncbi:hypothetical protein L873DRAFT_1456756 [Choiromyces venosus 120613-1]|uniref:Uncharacterized protein n=1 Tax=Choiromyces venosus 120613-1 TaxID=1336337 RepID=A0A3N4K0U4_9PEZI|nr:hypothetical protein L873DRAFT_1456756 [Choiromyces venosus 120613-1]
MTCFSEFTSHTRVILDLTLHKQPKSHSVEQPLPQTPHHQPTYQPPRNDCQCAASQPAPISNTPIPLPLPPHPIIIIRPLIHPSLPSPTQALTTNLLKQTVYRMLNNPPPPKSSQPNPTIAKTHRDAQKIVAF